MSFEYQGLKAEYERHLVTDEEIDRYLRALQEQNPRIAEVTDRPTKNGDEVVLDYAGYCNGVQFAGGTAQNQTLVLGSGAFIPGFEEQLLDKVPGEEVLVKVTFPEQYHAEDLAGKEAEFHCALRAIRVKTQYELDDTFAKEVGGCDTFEEFRSKLAESMQAYSDQRGEMDLQDRLLRQAAETLEVSFTEEQVAEAIDAQLQTLSAQLAQQGLTLDMYCRFMNTTEEKLREENRPAAEQELRSSAAVDEIVRLEKLSASKEDIDEACRQICRVNNISMEELQQHYDAEFEAVVVHTVLTQKAMAVIREAAEIL